MLDNISKSPNAILRLMVRWFGKSFAIVWLSYFIAFASSHALSRLICLQGYRLRTLKMIFVRRLFPRKKIFFMLNAIKQCSNQSSSCLSFVIIKTLYSTTFYPFSSWVPFFFLCKYNLMQHWHDLRIQIKIKIRLSWNRRYCQPFIF